MPRTRPAYSPEFRRRAVELLRSGTLLKQVADELGVSEQTLRNWRRQADVDGAMRDRAGSAQALNFLAAIDRDEGDFDTAVQRYAAAISLAREVGELWTICFALDGIAGAACTYGEHELAARLLACSQRLARRSGYRQSPHEQRLRDADTRTARDALSDRDFERATAEGQVMSAGDAVTAALAFAGRDP